jgi:hypothetical protein
VDVGKVHNLQGFASLLVGISSDTLVQIIDEIIILNDVWLVSKDFVGPNSGVLNDVI